MKQRFSHKEIVRLTVAGGYTQREIAVAANCATGTKSLGGANRLKLRKRV